MDGDKIIEKLQELTEKPPHIILCSMHHFEQQLLYEALKI